MSNVENLLIEHLKRFQAGQERIERKLDELVQRTGQLEQSVANLHRDFAHGEISDAGMSVRLDKVGERLDRIERRLEISHA
jgi:tetrahydromethanopterin S-methyltransferase subunit G